MNKITNVKQRLKAAEKHIANFNKPMGEFYDKGLREYWLELSVLSTVLDRLENRFPADDQERKLNDT